MPNPPLEQDWPAESRIVIAEDDIPEIPERPWDKPAAPPANTPTSPMEKFHRLRPQQSEPVRETPDSRRARTLNDIDAELSAAELALTGALAWARSIGYHPEVTEPLEAAAELIGKAQGLVDAFEART